MIDNDNRDRPAGTPKWLRGWKQSPMEAILPVISSGNVLSFALGVPDPQLLPREVLAEAAARAMESAVSLQYSSPSCRLKEFIAQIMAMRGLSCTPDCILITTGAQQALTLVARLLLEENSSVATEELVYPNFLEVVRPYMPNMIAVPTDMRTGIDLEALEERLKVWPRPACLYAMADGHNPLGIRMPASSRPRLAELLARYRVPLVEDDAYGFLCYEQQYAPPASSYAPEHMFYVGSFSKILGPSLRVGWIVAPPRLISILSTIKEAADLNTFTLSQRIAYECLRRIDFEGHVAHLVREYRARRDVMIGAISTYFPRSTVCQSPSGGFFAWVRLEEQINAMDLCRRSIAQEKIAFLPGCHFAVENQDRFASCLRLAFSSCSQRTIEDGMRRLGSLITNLREDVAEHQTASQPSW